MIRFFARSALVAVFAGAMLLVYGCGGAQETIEAPQTPEAQAALQHMEQMERQREEMTHQFIQQMPHIQDTQTGQASPGAY